jgi:hemerythrin-like domain-containing protein
MLDAFEDHARHEETFIFSLLESCGRVLMAEMEGEHSTDLALINELRGLMDVYKEATSAAQRCELGKDISYTVNEFIAFNLLHLNKEETSVNEVLWKNYTDIDIVRADQRLINGLQPEEFRNTVIWIMRSCSNMEIIGWINAIKSSISEPMFQTLMLLAEQELSAHRFEAVHNRIAEAV